MSYPRKTARNRDGKMQQDKAAAGQEPVELLSLLAIPFCALLPLETRPAAENRRESARAAWSEAT